MTYKEERRMKRIKVRKKSYEPQRRGGMPVYRPKVMTQKDMDEGLKELFQGAKRRSQESYPTPRRKPQPSTYKQLAPRQPQRPPEPQYEEYEEEPYWSAEEWEEWAIALYDSYPDLRPYLPEWFLEAVEE